MHANSNRWLSASAVGLLAVSGCLLLQGMQVPESRTVRLPDGTPVMLLGVTEGREPLILGTPLQKLLHAVLPPGQKHRAKVHEFNSPAIAGRSYWLKWKDGFSNNNMATVFDEHGSESPAVRTNARFPDAEMVVFTFEAYPRRGKFVSLRLYQDRTRSQDLFVHGEGEWQAVGEFRLSNPDPPATARWPAAKLPTTARAGDVDVTLTHLDVGLSVPRGPKPQHWTSEPFGLTPPLDKLASVGIRLSQHGRPAKGWYFIPESLSDATGNKWSIFPRVTRQKDALTNEHLFFTPPWPGEELWRLRGRLLRDEAATFRPEETWIGRDLPVPKAEQIIPIPNGIFSKQVPVEFVALYGPGTKLPPALSTIHMDGRVERGKVGLVVRVPGPEAADVVVNAAECRNERGEDLQLWSMGNGGYPKDTQYFYEAELPADSRKLSLKFVVQKARFVELTAPRTLLKP